MHAIGVFTFALCTVFVIYGNCLLLNQYFAYYYAAVWLVLCIPLIIGTFLFVMFFMKDRQSTRERLPLAVGLALLTIFLLTVWDLVYFWGLHKGEHIYTGMGDPDPNTYQFEIHYLRHTKKGYTFKFMTEFTILLVLYIFFAVYTVKYKGLYDEPEKEEADMETPADNDD